MTDINVDPLEAVEPPATPAEPVVPAAPAPTSDAPWAADLASAFSDEAERARVDQFMREKYQPYVTGLEQKHAPASKLIADLEGDDSLETYLGLAEQLYGEDVANLLAETILAKYTDDGEPVEPTAPAAPAADDTIPFEKLPPEMQQMYRDAEAKEAKDHYWSEMARVKEAWKGEDDQSLVNQDLFHPFVVGAGGDFDQALEQYKVWHATAYPAAPAPAAEEVPAPPATLGTDGLGHQPPPVAKRYTSYEDAMDDTLAEMRALRNPPPTTVGQA